MARKTRQWQIKETPAELNKLAFPCELSVVRRYVTRVANNSLAGQVETVK